MRKRYIPCIAILVFALLVACDRGNLSAPGTSQPRSPSPSPHALATTTPTSRPFGLEPDLPPSATAPARSPISLPTTTPPPATLSMPIGRIIFESDRTGDWDIYLLDLNTANNQCQFAGELDVIDKTWLLYTPIHMPDAVNLTNHPRDDVGAMWLPGGAAIAFASSRDGKLVADPETGEMIWSSAWYTMTPDGSNVIPLTAVAAQGGHLPTWSPDSRRIAYISLAESQPEIWLTDPRGLDRSFLTHGWAAAWSPNGEWIAFLRYPHGGYGDRTDSQLYLIHPDGSDEHLLLMAQNPIGNITWSPDSRKIAFNAVGSVNLLATEVSIVDREFDGGRCSGWSPDGQWLACEYSGGIYAVHVVNPWIIELVTRPQRGAVEDYLEPNWGP